MTSSSGQRLVLNIVASVQELASDFCSMFQGNMAAAAPPAEAPVGNNNTEALQLNERPAVMWLCGYVVHVGGLMADLVS